MFLFTGKQKRLRDKYRSAMDTVIGILELASEVAAGNGVDVETGNVSLEGQSGNINRKALGYIYGFTDAALQYRGLSIDNENGYSVIFGVLNKLCPGKAASYFIFLSSNLRDPEVTGGIFYGGQQYHDWVNSDGKKLPFGFALCLLEYSKHTAE